MSFWKYSRSIWFFDFRWQRGTRALGFRSLFAFSFGPGLRRRLPGLRTVKRLPPLRGRGMVDLQQQKRMRGLKIVSQSICGGLSPNRCKRIHIYVYNVCQPDSDRRKSRRMDNVQVPIVTCNNDWALTSDLENWQKAMRFQKCKSVAIYCAPPPRLPHTPRTQSCSGLFWFVLVCSGLFWYLLRNLFYAVRTTSRPQTLGARLEQAGGDQVSEQTRSRTSHQNKLRNKSEQIRTNSGTNQNKFEKFVQAGNYRSKRNQNKLPEQIRTNSGTNQNKSEQIRTNSRTGLEQSGVVLAQLWGTS